MNRSALAAGMTVALLGAGLTCPCLAQNRYQAPTIHYVDSGFYEITLALQAGATGAPEGFRLEWMKKADYDRLGGWPADDMDPAISHGDFYGTPTLNPSTGSFRLEPGATVLLQVGDLFDETGVISNRPDALEDGTEFVFRAKAEGWDGLESDYTPATTAQTTNSECTQGFWKNHPELWPGSCTPMLLGTVAYTKSQLLDIFNTPARGNGLISLAHQLIATNLNLCNGSDPTNVAQDIADANNLIGGLVIPPVGGGFLDPSETSSLTERLDRYNNGKVHGVVNCPTRNQSATWGGLKAQYR